MFANRAHLRDEGLLNVVARQWNQALLGLKTIVEGNPSIGTAQKQENDGAFEES